MRFVGKVIAWDKEPLGKEPDTVLAKRLGCSRQAVYLARKSRSIKASRVFTVRYPECRCSCGEPFQAKTPNTKFCSLACSATWRRLLETTGDPEIAVMKLAIWRLNRTIKGRI